MAQRNFSWAFSQINTNLGLSENFSDTREMPQWIKDNINQRLSEFSVISKSYKKIDSPEITTVASQEGYDLPDGTDKVIDVFYENGSETELLIEATPSLWNALQEFENISDSLEYYIVEGNQIKFYPTPETVGNKIIVKRFANTTDLTADTDPLTIKQGFEKLVVYGVMLDYYQGPGDDDGRANNLQPKFDKLFEKFEDDVKSSTNSFTNKYNGSIGITEIREPNITTV